MIITHTTDLLDLIGRDVALTRVAGTNGGEFHGACPFCQGGRDRFMVWPNLDRPAWWCRQCEKGGDDIQYLRERGHSFSEACQMLGYEGAATGDKADQPRAVIPPLSCDLPDEQWRCFAESFVDWAGRKLWRAADDRALAQLDYLHGRGLSNLTIIQASLGYNPSDLVRSRAEWGLPPDADHGDRLWLPAGIVIPWYVDGELWRISIRRPIDGPKKYYNVPGGSNVLYGADSVKMDRTAVLVEGVFDAMAVQQAAGDLVGAVASGTTGARRVRWMSRLAQCRSVLIAFDADQSGEHAASWWQSALGGLGHRWRPAFDDPAAMLAAGVDVRGWVEAGIGA